VAVLKYFIVKGERSGSSTWISIISDVQFIQSMSLHS
jgi:hypothetical protein